MRGARLLLALVVTMTAGTRAQADSKDDWARMKAIVPKGYVCGRCETPPKIDGRLDEAAWQSAAWTDEFVDIEGDRRPKPRFKTRAKMLWDDTCFYIAAQFEEPHADPVAVAVVAFQPADGPELFGQAVHGRFRQVGPLAQVGQAQHLIAHVERIEDRGDAAEHGSPSVARVLAA